VLYTPHTAQGDDKAVITVKILRCRMCNVQDQVSSVSHHHTHMSHHHLFFDLALQQEQRPGPGLFCLSGVFQKGLFCVSHLCFCGSLLRRLQRVSLSLMCDSVSYVCLCLLCVSLPRMWVSFVDLLCAASSAVCAPLVCPCGYSSRTWHACLSTNLACLSIHQYTYLSVSLSVCLFFNLCLSSITPPPPSHTHTHQCTYILNPQTGDDVGARRQIIV